MFGSNSRESRESPASPQTRALPVAPKRPYCDHGPHTPDATRIFAHDPDRDGRARLGQPGCPARDRRRLRGPSVLWRAASWPVAYRPRLQDRPCGPAALGRRRGGRCRHGPAAPFRRGHGRVAGFHAGPLHRLSQKTLRRRLHPGRQGRGAPQPGGHRLRQPRAPGLPGPARGPWRHRSVAATGVPLRFLVKRPAPLGPFRRQGQRRPLRHGRDRRPGPGRGPGPAGGRRRPACRCPHRTSRRGVFPQARRAGRAVPGSRHPDVAGP